MPNCVNSSSGYNTRSSKILSKLKKIAMIWKASHTPRRQITLLPRSWSSQNTTSLTRFQPHHLEHQGFGAVGAATTIVTLRRKGECKPKAKAYLCQTDRFSRGITRTGRNYQKKISNACWIHEARKRREVLATSDKFQTSLSSQSNYKS